MRPGTKPLVDETRWVPADMDQARQLYAALRDAGAPPQQARGIVGWLVDPEAQRADTNDPLRSRYRRVLARVGRPPWEGSRRAKGAYIRSNALAA